MIIDGTQIASILDLKLKAKIDDLAVLPRLAIVQIGDNSDSNSYVGAKKRSAEQLGIQVLHVKLRETATTLALIQKVKELGKDNNIHGIIIQLPVPKSLDARQIITSVPVSKDVDGFTVDSPFTPPVALGVLEVLKATGVKMKGKKIVVIGKGLTGGDTIIRTFGKLNIPYMVIHTKTKNPQEILKNADIIISAVGKPNMIRASYLKDKVILISVGISRKDGDLVGDYNVEKIKDIASYYTPTPGGIGPLTVHFLMENVYQAYHIICGGGIGRGFFEAEGLLRAYRSGL